MTDYVCACCHGHRWQIVWKRDDINPKGSALARCCPACNADGHARPGYEVDERTAPIEEVPE